MFSPSQLIQSLVQRTPISAPKPVELTEGQVFKGTVVKLYPDNMALVQIGGTKVQAKLEARLEEGQKAWLQVQPSSDVVTLKVLDTAGDGAGKEASLESLIRTLGLPDTKESKAIVTALMNANLPVNKETVQAFTAVAARLGTDDATLEAFMIAVKRNLPLTPDAVAGLKAFLSDKPISQAIQAFLQQSSAFLGEETAGGQPGQATGAMLQTQAGQTNGALRGLVSLLREKVAALPVTLSAAEDTTPLSPLAQQDGNRSTPAPAGPNTQNGQVLSQTADGTTKTISLAPTSGATALQGPSSGEAMRVSPNSTVPNPSAQLPGAQGGQLESVPSKTASAAEPQNSGSALSGASQNRNAVQATAGLSAPGREEPVPVTLPLAANREGAGVAEQSAKAPQATGNGQYVSLNQQGVLVNQESSAVPPGNHPIQELFRQMGIAHERDLLGQSLPGALPDARHLGQMESVKSMLLQVIQAPAHTVPTALREAADQLLQQVTGQQLMMVQPSSQALSQIVMQIPIRSAQGEDTAYVQIESKKRGGGQIDAENCRLFFHLDLKTMGTTMIDVSIVNRIVNLQIFNDTSWVEPIVHGMKDRFAQQLQDIGYQLSAVRVQSIPEQRAKSSAAAGVKETWLAEYKGVDLRV
ncbi:hypothetical protein [Brevibacillus brevis]|uniref:Flagellar hook-length control protein FliK n=1 Tax=Brevibacillus brevis TaxID=1393 RepID=A0ABY9SXM3_BREBE|nr:hypothetical protein [Brevibacillus brevis]WNC12577.1 hypothetical protein RGB73_17765 [Brevibacillus brevis]